MGYAAGAKSGNCEYGGLKTRYVPPVLATLAIVYITPFVFDGILSILWDIKATG